MGCNMSTGRKNSGRIGLIVAILVALLSTGGLVAAFLANASPYVTIAEAKQLQGDNLHLAGDILKETLKVDGAAQTVRFRLKDEKGEVVDVLYRGPQPANMGEATKVVVVGGVKDGVFEARKMLVKCPSKYESERKGGS